MFYTILCQRLSFHKRLSIDLLLQSINRLSINWTVYLYKQPIKYTPYINQSQINHVEYDSLKSGLLQIRGLFFKLQSNITNCCTKHYLKY